MFGIERERVCVDSARERGSMRVCEKSARTCESLREFFARVLLARVVSCEEDSVGGGVCVRVHCRKHGFMLPWGRERVGSPLC